MRRVPSFFFNIRENTFERTESIALPISVFVFVEIEVVVVYIVIVIVNAIVYDYEVIIIIVVFVIGISIVFFVFFVFCCDYFYVWKVQVIACVVRFFIGFCAFEVSEYVVVFVAVKSV